MIPVVIADMADVPMTGPFAAKLQGPDLSARTCGGRVSATRENGIWIWPTFRDRTGPGAGDRHASRTRLRSRSNLARPYIWRLSILIRLTVPSTVPEL